MKRPTLIRIIKEEVSTVLLERAREYSLEDYLRYVSYIRVLKTFGPATQINQSGQVPETIFLEMAEGTKVTGKDFSKEGAVILNDHRVNANQVNQFITGIKFILDKDLHSEIPNNKISKEIFQIAKKMMRKGSTPDGNLLKHSREIQIHQPHTPIWSPTDIDVSIKGDIESESARTISIQTVFDIITAPGLSPSKTKRSVAALKKKADSQQELYVQNYLSKEKRKTP